MPSRRRTLLKVIILGDSGSLLVLSLFVCICCMYVCMYVSASTETRVQNSLGLPFDVDVLSWWKCNNSKFPILSEMTRDVLAIQVSSVASESAFSTSGRVLDPYRSSLTPYMVEVLLCTQQWLRCAYKTEAEVSNLVQILAEVEFLESVDSRNSMPPSQ